VSGGADPGCGDYGASIAGTEVDQVIFRRHLRHLEHLVDERLWGWDPDDVLAGLADLWLVLLLVRLRLRLRLHGQHAGDSRRKKGRNGKARDTRSHDECSP
jgi:hypothetical protein